jgi:NAD(P)-dependent dehydrogenase (short-subunit alcohol dehydrogenase family)
MSGVALVTGSSSGIGLSTSMFLAQAGFSVVATMRDMGKAASVEAKAKEAGVKLDMRRLDVQDDNSVNACVNEVLTTYGRIDVLVNNAGAGYLGTLEMTPFDALRQTMDLNFFGVWRVTQAVFPSMRAAGSGRIITVSSVAGLVGLPFSDAYSAAKFAVEGLMESLAPVAKRFGISVSVVEPAFVNTGFSGAVQKLFISAAQPAREVYTPMLGPFIARARQMWDKTGQTANDVAKIIVDAATVEVPHFRYVTSEYGRTTVSQKYVDPTGDSVVAASSARLS